MPQVNSTISDEIDKMLTAIAKATGESKSGLIREYIRRGVYQDAEGLSKLKAFFKEQQNEDADPQNR